MEIDDEYVITSGLSIEALLSILQDFGVEHEHFFQAVKASEAKCWITMDSHGYPHMLVTDGEFGAVLLKTGLQSFASEIDAVERAGADPTMIVLPVCGEQCGIPFDFIRKFEAIVFDEEPQSEQQGLQADRVTH
tara:strand:- start:187 stop:588 length:402 start_codon:yes stop_codon:yes gene_type:complete